jgi:carbamoyltransferase
MPQYPAGAWIDTERFDYLKIKIDPSSWHKDPSLLSNTQKNLAWAVQNETQEYIAELIEKAVDMTGEKNIVISGGYGLNVIANYYYRERFPELNIYVDPISHDGGTSIGYAKLFANKKIGDDNGEHIKDPLTTLYLGPKYDIRSEDIDDLVDDTMEVTDVTDVDVAQLIKDRNIVSIFQGRSEAGPRALGNRSIVYDPTDPDGKAKVNTVKGREWFRPFAGSIMKEHAKEWFDLRGLDETPYMMYAMEMQPEKIGELPSVTHVDGTCRIQTVSQEQNENYYNLINEFYKLSGVPLLFNTSFNLGGQPLVETIFDAIHTLKNSQLEYLYLPELGKLIKLSNEK